MECASHTCEARGRVAPAQLSEQPVSRGRCTLGTGLRHVQCADEMSPSQTCVSGTVSSQKQAHC